MEQLSDRYSESLVPHFLLFSMSFLRGLIICFHGSFLQIMIRMDFGFSVIFSLGVSILVVL